MRRFVVAGLCFVLASAMALASEDEGMMRIQGLTIEAGKITSVTRDTRETVTTPDGRVHHGLWPRTIVKMHLQPAGGSNINVEMWLADEKQWNGRFLGLGSGGAAGYINSMDLSWAKGYAVAVTDMGTAPNDNSGVGNREVWKDFGFRATHLMTVCAKQVIKAYYGRDPEYSYFNGGSTGGQQGLQEAQRYPEDYDGIVSAVPAHCRAPLHAYFLWNDQILNKCHFTPAQEANIVAAGKEYMAGREMPATAGKMVSDPRCSSQDIEAVVALAMRKDPTLTSEQGDGLRKLFGGPRHSITGERIFCGIPFGSTFDIAHGHLYLFRWVFGVNKNPAEIDFGKDMDTYLAALGPYLNAENADLTAFKNRGGKLIITSGSADSCVPYHATLDYYERVVEHFGSLEEVQSFARFYLIPGMSHGPGPGINSLPDLIGLVVNWREKGIAPEALQGRRIVDGKTEMEFPIYPYPMKTAWDETTRSYKPVAGPRGGVERVADRFRPAPAD